MMRRLEKLEIIALSQGGILTTDDIAAALQISREKVLEYIKFNEKLGIFKRVADGKFMFIRHVNSMANENRKEAEA